MKPESIRMRFFNCEPVAAASIAQVHKAKMASNGKTVAVKILRPKIERAFQKDIDAFYFAAGMIEFLSPGSRRLRPTDVIAHFEGVVLGELDLRLETAAAVNLQPIHKRIKALHCQASEWPLSSRRVMTMGWAEGVPMGDNDALEAAGHDRAKLGERVLNCSFSTLCGMGIFMRICIKEI